MSTLIDLSITSLYNIPIVYALYWTPSPEAESALVTWAFTVTMEMDHPNSSYGYLNAKGNLQSP